MVQNAGAPPPPALSPRPLAANARAPWVGQVYFSACSPIFQAEISWAVREVEFDRSILLSEDPPLPGGLCPGQEDENQPACSGHGSCVGYNMDNTPLPATCFCNPGWLGESCAIERFGGLPMIEIVTPENNLDCNLTDDGGVEVYYLASTVSRTNRMIMEQREWWDDCEVVLYVDGEPYPQVRHLSACSRHRLKTPAQPLTGSVPPCPAQPYPNNIFPLPAVNMTGDTLIVHNLKVRPCPNRPQTAPRLPGPDAAAD